MTALRQEELRLDLLRRIDALSSQALRWRNGLRPDQVAWSPGQGAWSIGQVFEHLVQANAAYLPLLDGLVSGTRERAGEQATWKPTIMGNLLVRSQVSPRKLTAPKQWRPAPAARPAVIDAFLDTIAGTRRLMEGAAGVPWDRLRFGSPLLSLVRLNLGDGFTVIAAHAERHFRQVERIGRASGFPV